jgi:cytochrome P450
MVKAVESSMRGTDVDAGYLDHLELIEYFEALARRGSAGRSDTVVGALVAATQELDLTLDEVLLTCDNIAVAAGEATAQTGASGLLAFTEHPPQWRKLQAGDVRLVSAVDEIVRWSSTGVHVLRTTTRPTRLAGVDLPADSPVTCWLPSMNRDEEEFCRGGELLLDRRPNRHAAFGVGRHTCLGAAVARVVLGALLREIRSRVRTIGVAGEPQRIASYYVGGFASLPMTMSSH